ncbi:MAG: SDR family NAD(P)-dependent oxidoreductase [Anaerolineae bacterium]
MPGRLEDRVAVVTGASRGIGRATALALAKEGAHVVITARTEADLLSLADEIGELRRDALPVVADVSVDEDVNRLYEQALSRFERRRHSGQQRGRGQVRCAGEPHRRGLRLDDEQQHALQLSVHAGVPAPDAGASEGWIVFVGSVAGLKGLPHETVYCASKHGTALRWRLTTNVTTATSR